LYLQNSNQLKHQDWNRVATLKVFRSFIPVSDTTLSEKNSVNTHPDRRQHRHNAVETTAQPITVITQSPAQSNDAVELSTITVITRS
jgi:hypothetical protein